MIILFAGSQAVTHGWSSSYSIFWPIPLCPSHLSTYSSVGPSRKVPVLKSTRNILPAYPKVPFANGFPLCLFFPLIKNRPQLIARYCGAVFQAKFQTLAAVACQMRPLKLIVMNNHYLTFLAIHLNSNTGDTWKKLPCVVERASQFTCSASGTKHCRKKLHLVRSFQKRRLFLEGYAFYLNIYHILCSMLLCEQA